MLDGVFGGQGFPGAGVGGYEDRVALADGLDRVFLKGGKGEGEQGKGVQKVG